MFFLILLLGWIMLFFKFIGFAIETLSDWEEFKENWLRLFLAVLGLFGLPFLILCTLGSVNRSS